MYDDPEKFGLKIIGMVDKTGNNGFDMFVVWKQGRRLCYGMDEGCSCPTNFEDKGVDDLTLAPKADVIKALKTWAAPTGEPEDYNRRDQDDLDAAVVELCLKIQAA